jgi:protein-L-isoaspartate(D-aspartate) O-methyltransferase
MAISIRTARRLFAEELRYTAHLQSRALINAIATTPREHFLDPGPWRILSPLNIFSPGGSAYWTSDDADPRHLYHDVLIALDEPRRLNNGRPSFLTFLLDQLKLSPRMHVVHIGAGLGLL